MVFPVVALKSSWIRPCYSSRQDSTVKLTTQETTSSKIFNYLKLKGSVTADVAELLKWYEYQWYLWNSRWILVPIKDKSTTSTLKYISNALAGYPRHNHDAQLSNCQSNIRRSWLSGTSKNSNNDNNTAGQKSLLERYGLENGDAGSVMGNYFAFFAKQL